VALSSEGVLTACIRDVRRALGDEARQPRYIETVHRRGYRFVAAP
jgi:DNA-binding winged helix-turn-helix (wHTH) protein